MNSSSDPFPPSLPRLDSPPIFDTDMTTSIPSGDLYFHSALPIDSPGRFLADDIFDSSPFQSPVPMKAQKIPSKAPAARPVNNSSTSPESSSHDSSSDSSGRHKRKTSSKSSVSGATRHENAGPGTNEWKTEDSMDIVTEPAFDFSAPPVSNYDSYDFSNRAMENDFDFTSAASSPSPILKAGTPVHQANRHIAIPYRASPRSVASLIPQTSSSGASEASPLANTIGTQYGMKTQNSHASPASSNEEYIGGAMVNGMEQLTTWPYESRPLNNGFSANMPSRKPQANATSGPLVSPSTLGQSQTTPPMKPILAIHPTPHKSRVETQIPIKMTLCPMPQGIKKLHLPPHTISKPKLLSKEPLPKSSDTLELQTMLVCTSAMQDPAKMRRAFHRAAHGSIEVQKPAPRRSSSGDVAAELAEEDQPLNGGPVHICEGCILRERKRAARKKSKKPEEEEPWQRDEAKRIIVFNTSEVKDWQAPLDPHDGLEILEAARLKFNLNLETAKQIDVPMRIACYCRHQNEKLGFQVILTLKDYEDNLVAQAITNPIVITDDHKTHAPPTMPNSVSMFGEHPMLPGGGMFGREPLENYAAPLFRNAHSTTDLQNLQQNYQPQPFLPPSISPYAVPQSSSHTTSTTLTPRNLSRQASPSAQAGPMQKKRKSSGSGKLPDGLTMTRLQTPAEHNLVNQSWTTAAPSNPVSPAVLPPYSATYSVNENPQERQFSQAPTSRQAQFNTGPPTPNSADQNFFSNANRSQSLENLSQVQYMFSASNSTRPSRAPSPITGQQQANALPSAHAPTVASAVLGLPNGNPHRPPTIHKLIPNEGSKAGGIEVTCLGSGFCQGLEVMFGDSLATTTTYWGETSLVCLLPPAIRAGTVAVTFKHQHQQQQQMQNSRYPSPPVAKQSVFFRYVDDDEQEIVKHALLLVHQKMTGTIEDVGEIARRIVNGPHYGTGGAWTYNGGQQGDHHMRQVSTMQTSLADATDTETAVLKCVDVIDLDDSPYQAHLNLRRPNGQSMLHLSASLGYHRLVAGLLARGANPDLRDRNGMSPMHMAALNGHSQIVRRLRLAGGDPTLRSLRGYTPMDMASSQSVFDAIQALQSHIRSRSAGASSVSLVSQISSTTSLRSLWDPNSIANASISSGDFSEDDSDDDAVDDTAYSDRGARHVPTPAQLWAHSRRNSTSIEQRARSGPGPQQLVEPPGFVFPAAAMTAWRDQLAAQIQHFHQSVNWTLPNLQIPTLPPMPQLPDYRADAMVRRFSSLVPQRQSSLTTSPRGSTENKENDYRWWELLTGTTPSPPPYEEIYPTPSQEAYDVKTESAARAAADALADEKCNLELQSAGTCTLGDVGHTQAAITSQYHEHLRDAHARKVKRLRSDRNLFFIWIPLLLFVVMAVLTDRAPKAWRGAQQAFAFVQARYQERLVEVL